MNQRSDREAAAEQEPNTGIAQEPNTKTQEPNTGAIQEPNTGVAQEGDEDRLESSEN